MLHVAGGVTEDLSAQLAQSCPAYFKEDDKIFYEASGLLQRAEAATAAAEKDHLTRSALKLMMKVGSSSVYLFRHTQNRDTAPSDTFRQLVQHEAQRQARAGEWICLWDTFR